MSLSPEIIVERKKYRQKLAIWQILTITALAITTGMVLNRGHIKNLSSPKIMHDYIASITIEDELIIENEKRDKIIESLKDDKYVKAVIVNINSPGGTAVGSEIVYKILRDIAKDKPVVTVMNSMATSGAYMISLASDYIVAHHCTITGSIGVIIRSLEVTDLADKMGVKFINLKTNTNKAALSPTEKLSPEVEEVIMESLHDTYEFFVNLVAERRKLAKDEAIRLADGRIYTGNQALKLKLIDAIGTKKDAIEWLHKNRKIPENLKVKEVSLRSKESLIEELLGKISSGLKVNLIQYSKGILAVYNN